jgi:hypothetical protein
MGRSITAATAGSATAHKVDTDFTGGERQVAPFVNTAVDARRARVRAVGGRS